MIAKNYYNVLGLNPSCAPQDIKKSYHKLALVWHPDKHNNKSEAQSKFTEINEAYSILADSKKRMIYDTCGPEGLVRDQELRDFANCNQNNTFYQKGFQGTDKSAFDVLRDIFEESDDEDDDFFEDCNLFNLSDNFKDNLKAFIDEMIPSESEEDFKNYIPTFMDADFLCHSSLFEQVIPDNDDCSAHTEFFSYFTSSLDTDDIQNFSKKSNKNKNAKKKKTQKEDIIYEEAEFDEYIELGPRPSKKTKNDKSKYVEEVVLDEEDFAELFEKHNNKNDKKKSKKQNKQSKEAQGNGKVKGRLHSELDDEEEKGKKYNQKNQKKNKK